MKDYIHFYSSDSPDLLAIERASIDRTGKVIDHLNQQLPKGSILDVSERNGFTDIYSKHSHLH